MACRTLFVDVESPKFKPVTDLFNIEFRPDLAILQSDYVTVLELTVCHETNMAKSKAYKLNKYRDLSKALKISKPIKTFSIEVSTLGFVADISEFVANEGLPRMPKVVKIANLALEYSYSIYRNRNSATLSKLI